MYKIIFMTDMRKDFLNKYKDNNPLLSKFKL